MPASPVFGIGGAGVGVGVASTAQGPFGNLIFGSTIVEALGIFSLLIALLLLYQF